jgi:non-ribosomal peptide synthetase component F/thioesterase domain-containing protein
MSGNFDNIIDKQNSSGLFALSHFQQFMVHNDLNAKEGTGCCVCQIIMTLDYDIDIKCFHQAWLKTLLQYEQLQLCFREKGNRLLQYTTTLTEIHVEYHDWTAAKTKEDLIDTFLKADRRLGFSLFNPPLFRLTLFKLSNHRHILLFSYHNVIADYTSVSLILRSFFTHYLYPDSSGASSCRFRRQVETLSNWKNHPEAVLFWKTYLEESSAPLTLPIPENKRTPDSDKRSPLALTLTSAAFTQQFNTKITQDLTAICLEMDTELETFLFAAWIVVLSHYTGSVDLLTGVIRPISEDPARMDENGCPPQRNILPTRISIHPEERFSQVLNRIKTLWQRIRQFGHCTMMDIHSWAGLDPKNCWRYTLFSFVSSDVKSAAGKAFKEMGGSNLTFVEWVPGPLYLAVCGTTSLLATLKYDRRLYSHQRIETLMTHFIQVVSVVARGNDPVLKNIPVSESLPLPDISNNRLYDDHMKKPGSLIHHLIDIQAAAGKDSPAVLDTRRKISYSELTSKGDQIAFYLNTLGSGPDKRILILVAPGIEAASSLLGILKSGSICIPCPPPSNSWQTTQKVIELTSPDVIITQLRYREELQDIYGKNLPPVFFLDDHKGERVSPDLVGTQQNPASENTAIMIFSEIDPGKPKVIEISHSALLAHIYSMSDVLSFQPGDRILTLDFRDMGILASDILISLFNGTGIIIPPAETAVSAQAIMTLCRQMEVTVLQLTPSLFQHMTEQAEHLDFSENLRLIILHDDFSDTKLLADIQRHIPESCRVVVIYGPAETTFGATWKEVAYGSGDLSDADFYNGVGTPFSGIHLCVLNHFLQPAFAGTTGELFIGGLQLAKGFYQQKELTQKEFVHLDHISPDTRFFKTDRPVTRQFSGLLSFQQNNASEFSGTILEKKLSRPPPIILVGNSVNAARSYRSFDLKGHSFFHAPIFVHFYTKPHHQRLSIDIPQLAAACLKDTIHAFPDGPYILMGECQNAVVAHEMAVQLEQTEKKVALLIIIDENWHDKTKMHVSAPSDHTPFLKRQINRLQMYGITYLLAKILERMKNIILRRVYALDPFRNKLYIALNLTAPHSLQFRIMENVFYQACDKNPYEPSPYDGPVLLLYSHQWVTLHQPLLNRFYTGRVETKEFPIAHSEWFKPEQINSILKEIHKILYP